MLVLEGLVGLYRTIQLQLLQHCWLGPRLALLWYWMVCLGNEQRSFCGFWDCIQVLHFGPFSWPWWLFHFFWGILAHSSRYNGHLSQIHPFQSILVRWFLKGLHSLLHLLFDHFQFALIHGPNIPGAYAILLFITLDLASITSHIHNWVLFFLWLCLFILFGVISLLIFSSILGTYGPGEFI